MNDNQHHFLYKGPVMTVEHFRQSSTTTMLEKLESDMDSERCTEMKTILHELATTISQLLHIEDNSYDELSPLTVASRNLAIPQQPSQAVPVAANVPPHQ